MSRPETRRAAFRDRDQGVVFQEQWHAQAVALVELLVADRKLDPEAWSRALGAELDRRAAEGAPDTDETYYDAFLKVLETTLDDARIAQATDVDQREADWKDAYLSTPHGQPVVLKG